MASFTSFAEDILASARQLDEYFISQNLSPPTFDNNCVSDLPKDISIIRNKLINTTHTLKQLAQGPVDIILQQILSVNSIILDRAR